MMRTAAMTVTSRRGLPLGLALVTLVASCQGRGDSARRAAATGLPASAGQAGSRSQDPCTLLTPAEVQPYTGALVAQPYRATDDAVPAASGEVCIYRGAARELKVTLLPSGGATAGHAINSVPEIMNRALSHDSAAAGMTTTVNKVMSRGPAGPWETALWMPSGSLMLTKSDVAVIIDVSGASGTENDAYALARLAIPRVEHPLDYDGAKAVAHAPAPPAHPGNPCDFLPRADVEVAIGPLADASVSPDSTVCTYHVHSAQGERAYPVAFTWRDGLTGYNRMKHAMAVVSGLLGTPASSPLDTMKPTGNMGQMIGGLMKMVGGASAANGAPGAATTEGFRTDTALVGPWDNASLLHGTELLAVRHDVLITMDLQTADYEKAKALLAAICRRL